MKFSAKKLQDLRIISGYTQAEVSEKLDVSLRTYQNWEYGKSVPSLRNLRKLENFFKSSFTFRSII